MSITKLLPFIIILLAVFACHTGPKKSEVIKIDASNAEKFCLLKDIKTLNEGLLLKNQLSAVSSNFKVRNFEFTAKLKTTAGSAGVLIFAEPEANSPEKGYEV